MSLRVCSQPGCATLIDTSGYCPSHARERDTARGSRQDRGYDAAHDAERARWARIIKRTSVPCARCHEPITDGMAWDLGHTDDRKAWTGPEHAGPCNRSAAGKASHQTT